jgi:hypothetical protein
MSSASGDASGPSPTIATTAHLTVATARARLSPSTIARLSEGGGPMSPHYPVDVGGDANVR